MLSLYWEGATEGSRAAAFGEDYRFERLDPRYDCTREFERYQFTHLSWSRYRRDGAAEQRAIAAALREAQTGPAILEIGEFAPNVVVKQRPDAPEFHGPPHEQPRAWNVIDAPGGSLNFNTVLDRFINGDESATCKASEVISDLSAGRGGSVVRGIPPAWSIVKHRVIGTDPEGESSSRVFADGAGNGLGQITITVK